MTILTGTRQPRAPQRFLASPQAGACDFLLREHEDSGLAKCPSSAAPLACD